MTSTDTLERCARALAIRAVGHDQHWFNYVSDARTVIEALMEPDEAMLRAGEMAVLSEGAGDFVGGDCVTMSAKFSKAEVKAVIQASLRAVLGGEG